MQKTLFFNRELSWLHFNTRVLHQAKRKEFPLLERLKFLAIYATNLDEFYMIRIAGLKRLDASGMRQIADDDLSIQEQLEAIEHYLREEQKELENLYCNILCALQKEHFIITHFDALRDEQKQRMRHYFLTHLYPIIVPIVVDLTNPFPHLNNLSFGLVLKLQSKEKMKFAIVRIPKVLERFVCVEKGLFIPVEELIGAFAHELFHGFSVLKFLSFRVTRNADIEIQQEEADDFIALMDKGIRARRNGKIVRLEFCGKRRDFELEDFVKKHMAIKDHAIYFYRTLLHMAALWELVMHKDFAHLAFSPFIPKLLVPLDEKNDLFERVKQQDILFFHPYESFETIQDFIHQASIDPYVLSIRMTLYRVGKDSAIVESLIKATQTKQVTVFVELKARFDEENNLHWAKALENAGAHVIYGIPNLKVHAKVALVIRREDTKLQGYVHLSTGNYNPVSAKIYTDIGMLTSNDALSDDVIKFFHALSIGVAYKKTLDYLYIAPMQIKQKLLELIEHEMQYAQEGHIILKANALVDQDIIRALYQASNAGVTIQLLVRGICCLIPQVRGMSERIWVFSLVGKYLEHARIYYFKHHDAIYFSSADLMPRNLERRVEMLVPITQPNLYQKIFDILQEQLRDDCNLYALQDDGSYKKLPTKQGRNAQLFYEEWAEKTSLYQQEEDY